MVLPSLNRFIYLFLSSDLNIPTAHASSPCCSVRDPLKAEVCSLRWASSILISHRLFFVNAGSSRIKPVMKNKEWMSHSGLRKTVSSDSFCPAERECIRWIGSQYCTDTAAWQWQSSMEKDTFPTCSLYTAIMFRGVLTQDLFPVKCEVALHWCFTASYECTGLNVDHLLRFTLKAWKLVEMSWEKVLNT